MLPGSASPQADLAAARNEGRGIDHDQHVQQGLPQAFMHDRQIALQRQQNGFRISLFEKLRRAAGPFALTWLASRHRTLDP